MNKNQANLFLFVARDSAGVGRAGLYPALKISKDGGTFAYTTNSVSAVDATNAPGLYQCQLTQTECNCDQLVIQCTMATGDNPAIIGIYEMETPIPDLSSFIELVESGILHWSTTADTLTLYDSSDNAIGTYTLTRDSKGVITAISPASE